MGLLILFGRIGDRVGLPITRAKTPNLPANGVCSTGLIFNYVLIDATDAGATGKEVVDYVFKKAGVMLKHFAPLRGRNGYFRISLGTHEENSICVQFIKQFFENRKKEKKA